MMVIALSSLLSCFVSILLLLMTILTSVTSSRNYGGRLLNQAMDAVLGPQVRHTTESESHHQQEDSSINMLGNNLPFSSIRIRCRRTVACDEYLPTLEIHNAIFRNGILYLNQLDHTGQAVVNSLESFLAGRAGMLPSSLVMYNDVPDWLPGPKVVSIDRNNASDAELATYPSQCDKVWDTSAYFLFPWEVRNSFHAMNDNVFSILASVLLQRVSLAPGSLGTEAKTLFLFNIKQVERSLLWKLLYLLFEDDVRPARELLGLNNITHCVRHVAWGPTLKPFYKDSLTHLRRALFEVLRFAVRRSGHFPSGPNPRFFDSRIPEQQRASTPPKELSSKYKDQFKAVIVTRRDVESPNNARKLAVGTEDELERIFREKGVLAVTCCNYKVVASLTQLMSYFAFSDICVGVHGAGLMNCVLAKRGVIVFEMQVVEGFGFDSYMKMAHMAAGTYIFYDIRNLQKEKGALGGSVLIKKQLNSIVNSSIAARKVTNEQWSHDRRHLLGLFSWLWSSPEPEVTTNSPNLQHRTGLPRVPGTMSFKHPEKSLSRTHDKHAKANSNGVHGSHQSSKDPLAAARERQRAMQSHWAQRGYNVSILGKALGVKAPGSWTAIPPFWIISANESETIQAGEIVGPSSIDHSIFCQSLPYYKFRLLLLMAKDHSFKCDARDRQIKPRGYAAGHLTDYFVN